MLLSASSAAAIVRRTRLRHEWFGSFCRVNASRSFATPGGGSINSTRNWGSGRDDFLQPSVEIPPYYNRLVWNYTRGIDSGEVIYALNYNILDQDSNGSVDAADAVRLFPQAHGDAYGHYLTALMGYYSLLMNKSFDWVPRIEAVSLLGQPLRHP